MKLFNRYIRKILPMIIMLIMMFALTACGIKKPSETISAETTAKETQKESVSETSQNKTSQADSQVEVKSDSTTNTLVVYFSHTGTTKKVAEYLHGIVGGDLIELEPVKEYPSGYSAALDPAKQEQRDNARPDLKTSISNFKSYNTVYIGYPIWWGTVPMLVNTFLESYDFSGKTVIPFATSGGTGISKSISDIRDEIPDANVKDGLLVRNTSDIKPWLEKLGVNANN